MNRRQLIKELARTNVKMNYVNSLIVYIIYLVVSRAHTFLQSPEKFNIEYLTSFGQKTAEMDFGTKITFSAIALIFGILILAPARYGAARFYFNNSSTKPSFTEMLSVLKYYKKSVLLDLLASIKVLLWTLLLVIPGIIKSYEYAMLPYILADDPTISMSDAFKESYRIMSGHKWELFVLHLSFIGWNLLGIITFGITEVLYSGPYREAAVANFYKVCKELSQKKTQE